MECFFVINSPVDIIKLAKTGRDMLPDETKTIQFNSFGYGASYKIFKELGL